MIMIDDNMTWKLTLILAPCGKFNIVLRQTYRLLYIVRASIESNKTFVALLTVLRAHKVAFPLLSLNFLRVTDFWSGER